MFAKIVSISRIDAQNQTHPCPLAWIDSFAMRNFTNDAVFDDTLPIRDGLLEVGNLVPLNRLRDSMEAWFRRKGYLQNEERVQVEEIVPSTPHAL